MSGSSYDHTRVAGGFQGECFLRHLGEPRRALGDTREYWGVLSYQRGSPSFKDAATCVAVFLGGMLRSSLLKRAGSGASTKRFQAESWNVPYLKRKTVGK